jgi:small subunit ribosomal protein S16
LARAGAKKRPFYRVVATDRRTPRDGRFIEHIGSYDPTKKPSTLIIDQERLEHWLSVGARPSDTVRQLLLKHRKEAPAAG